METKQKISQLLSKFGLRRTPTRTEVLKLYLDRNYALAHKDIEDELSVQFDRVTIYRTLNTFEEKGLIHKVYDGNTVAKFALCGDECHEEEHHHHQHNHLHFTCNNCEKTFCIDSAEVPQVQLPSKFKTDSVHLFAKGLCENCNL